MLLRKTRQSVASRPHNSGKRTSSLQPSGLSCFHRASDETDLTGGHMKDVSEARRESESSFNHPNEK